MSGGRLFSGETESQAVLEAAAAFGLAPGELAFRRLDRKPGMLRRGRVVIEVDPAQPRRVATPVEAVPRVPTTDRDHPPAASPGEAAMADGGGTSRSRPHDALAGFTRDEERTASPLEPFAPARGREGALAAADALAALADLELEAVAVVAAGEEGEEVRVELSGRDTATLLADNGDVLGATEYLLRRMVRDLPPGGLLADSGGFHAERVESLRRRAAAAAMEVRRTGEPILFEPLPASERRVVHLAIQGETGVASASEGDGELRRVRVAPIHAG